jgi:hypothetical protein
VKVHDVLAGEGGSVTLGGQFVVTPTGLVGVNVTVPMNDPNAVTVTVVAAPFAPVLKLTGLVAEIEKSTKGVTVATTLTELDAVPIVPITFTVYVFTAVHLGTGLPKHVTVTFKVRELVPPAATPSISE